MVYSVFVVQQVLYFYDTVGFIVICLQILDVLGGLVVRSGSCSSDNSGFLSFSIRHSERGNWKTR